MRNSVWGENKRLMRTYYAMMHRCYNESDAAYQYYGGRGIGVCDEWRKDPRSFLEWSLSNGYDNNARGHFNSIDRINNDLGYSPQNCGWVTMYEQAANRRKRKVNDKWLAQLEEARKSRKQQIRRGKDDIVVEPGIKIGG